VSEVKPVVMRCNIHAGLSPADPLLGCPACARVASCLLPAPFPGSPALAPALRVPVQGVGPRLTADFGLAPVWQWTAMAPTPQP